MLEDEREAQEFWGSARCAGRGDTHMEKPPATVETAMMLALLRGAEEIQMG
jgi:hypothetical protein